MHFTNRQDKTRGLIADAYISLGQKDITFLIIYAYNLS